MSSSDETGQAAGSSASPITVTLRANMPATKARFSRRIYRRRRLSAAPTSCCQVLPSFRFRCAIGCIFPAAGACPKSRKTIRGRLCPGRSKYQMIGTHRRRGFRARLLLFVTRSDYANFYTNECKIAIPAIPEHHQDDTVSRAAVARCP